MASSSAPAIVASGLVKRFGSITALDGLDLEVAEGTVLGLLGPNGAGKTTAVSILTTLIKPDAGEALIAGANVLTEPQEVRRRIGLSGQYSAVDEVLTGFENLDMIGRLYKLGRAASKRRARELLSRFDLNEAADRPVRTYSGGMRRRLDLAGALVAQPPVIFLDEPTTGLDPRSRIELWRIIRELVSSGATLLLTTQYLEEADQLADDIVVIDHGRIIAHGTSDELKRSVGGERVEIVLATADSFEVTRRVLDRHATAAIDSDLATKSLHAPVADGLDSLRAIIDDLATADVVVRDIGLRRPTLDDVFMSLTGHGARDDSATVPDLAGGPG